MIGQVLGGRYDILDQIGGGGMALVYKARDLLLHRIVAIKLLRSQFAHDEEFIQRFRREAQAAASLSHPNIVSIYDVGEVDGKQYIVMEYVEGVTLNELIKGKAPLQTEEAVHIATQICDALGHAHANHIIHRDIKPHNILIGKNGRVKVTDFGIARASNYSSITQTGSVVGSVHYFSPEHAQGTSAGEKSDLYSLGIVMYQMLTGKLPFIGESPISVALKHLREDVEEPRKVNPHIPQSVENIILKAMRKKPQERYQTAADMLADLETCLSPERLNEAKIRFDETGEDAEETRVVPAIGRDRGVVERQSRTEQGEAEEHEEASPRKKRWVKPVVWLAVLLFVAIGAWQGVAFMLNQLDVKEVPVPDVVHLHVDEAKAKLAEAELHSEIIYEYHEEVEKDHVIQQEPSAMNVKVGSTVTLYVSQGIELKTMENFVGQLWSDVRAELLAAGFGEDRLEMTAVFSDAPPDTIVQQEPAANTEYDPASAVFKFTVSKGKETRTMPDLTGKTLAQAEALLKEAGLKLAPDGVVEEPSFEQPKGLVFKQFPFEPGQEVEVGQSIKVFVSAGPPPDAVRVDYTLPPLVPAKEGTPSTFRIVVSDVQHENYEYKTAQIAQPEMLTVSVTVTKDRNAIIQVFRDNKLLDTHTVTYRDYELQQPAPPDDEEDMETSAEPDAAPDESAENDEAEGGRE